ncbi:MAG: NUDIX hydrolase [Gammaproteobacteria bacterium]|nr:NUDIX hydrolase [Gammaproteobacteria bacterium]
MDKQEQQFRETISELRVAIAAVDVVTFAIVNDSLHVFLIPVHNPPHYPNMFGLPGGVIQKEESADVAANRHLNEKANLKDCYLEQLYTFSDPKRDKRSRSISIAYMALLGPDQQKKQTTSNGVWVPLDKLPTVAYDHADMIEVAIERLQGRLIYTNIIKNLLPKQFTLPELQRAYEMILDQSFDKRNFRKKFLSTGLIRDTGKTRKTSHRPARLYQFLKKELMIISEVFSAA